MSEVVFARTRHEYDSYADFWDLVAHSAFSVCFVDEIDVARDCIYITTPINGDTFPHLDNELAAKPKRSRLVWWNMERHDAPGAQPLAEALTEVMQRFDAAWTSDRMIAARDARLTFAVMGSVAALRQDEPPPHTEYDFCHYSYACPRRAPLYARCRQVGLSEAPGAWTRDDRDRMLKRARIMLNAQQHPEAVTAPLRFAIAAAYSLPIVSETISDPYPLEVGRHMVQAPFQDLPGVIADLLRQPERLAAMGAAVHETLCREWPFRRGVAEAVRASLGEEIA